MEPIWIHLLFFFSILLRRLAPLNINLDELISVVEWTPSILFFFIPKRNEPGWIIWGAVGSSPLPWSLFQQGHYLPSCRFRRVGVSLCWVLLSSLTRRLFDFLNINNYVPAPIGSVYKFLPTGTDAPPSAQPRAAVHGAPPAGPVEFHAL